VNDRILVGHDELSQCSVREPSDPGRHLPTEAPIDPFRENCAGNTIAHLGARYGVANCHNLPGAIRKRNDVGLDPRCKIISSLALRVAARIRISTPRGPGRARHGHVAPIQRCPRPQWDGSSSWRVSDQLFGHALHLTVNW
jgi:hypothetical protein